MVEGALGTGVQAARARRVQRSDLGMGSILALGSCELAGIFWDGGWPSLQIKGVVQISALTGL
jgi:hypothetical protein